MFSSSGLIVVAAVTLASSCCSSSTAVAGSECPCYPSNGNTSYIICNDTSMTSIPDCVASSTVHLSIRTPSITLVPKAIRRFTNLRRLHVEHFEYPRFTKVFLGGQSNLFFFQIYDTSLEYVDKEWFKYAPNIRTLVIAENKIRYLAPDVFSYLPLLDTAYMYRNQLSTLSPTIFDGTSLKAIYLHDNPWQCDCELATFVQWARDKKVSSKDKAICSYPVQLAGLNLKELTPDVGCTN